MRIALTLTLAFALSACGTIIHGSNQQVSFTSEPTGAEVIVDGLSLGSAPLVTALSRKDTHTVEFKLDGYAPKSAIVNRSVSGWVWGNIIFGGLIGLGVDAVTGGMYKLTPEMVNGDFSVASLEGSDTLMIAVTMGIPEGAEMIGQLERAD